MASGRTGSPGAKEPLLEWVAAAIGLVLTLGMMALIGIEALRGDAAQPPAIEVRVTSIAAAPSGFLVEVEAVNRSAGTGADVRIEGVLKTGDVEVEASDLILDYVPGHARRKGGLFFTRDPRRHRLEVRAVGYQAP